MKDALPAPPTGLVLTEHFDHAVLKIPRVYPRSDLRLRWLLIAAILAPLLLPALAMISDEAVLAGMLLWTAAVLLSMPALGWWLRRQSAPYVEVTITDRTVELVTKRPHRSILLARDDIQRLEVHASGLLVHSSAGVVAVFAGRPAEQTAWLKALLIHLTREDGQGGRAAIPQALAAVGLRAR